MALIATSETFLTSSSSMSVAFIFIVFSIELGGFDEIG